MKTIKQIIRSILQNHVDIIHSNYDEKNFTKALYQYTKDNPSTLSEFRNVGKRKDNKEFYGEVKKIEDGYNLLYRDLSVYDDNGVPKIDEYSSIRNGNPLRLKPFPLCRKYAIRSLYSHHLYIYPPVITGEKDYLGHAVNYLKREGFQTQKSDNYDGLGIENIIFTYSTMHAYTLILNTIARPEDVILMTGPNYGIFAVSTEVFNAKVEIINLREEDDFYINPELLSKRIDEINQNLKKEFDGVLDYTPKVVAFLNINPHNPTGKVLNHKTKDILLKMGDVCLEKGVFVIDDMVYRDLTYDQEDLAIPLASIPKYFNNTITIMGLSKSYSLAGLRAGMIIAPIPICRGIENQISASLDCISMVQSAALAGAFNGTNQRYKVAKKYFGKSIKEYKYRLHLLEALIYGIEYENIREYKDKILKELKTYTKDQEKLSILLKGIPKTKIRKKAYPESGFFAMIDFTELKGLKDEEITIQNDADFVTYLYKKTKINCLMGLNMSWPYKDEIVARCNFAIEKQDLIHNFYLINKAVRELK